MSGPTQLVQQVLGAVATVAGVTVVGIGSAWLCKRTRRRRQLALAYELNGVDSASVAFDATNARIEKTLAFDRFSLLVNGRRLLLLSAEFHPWRIPDRPRWRTVLANFKEMGFNCIRIYFHWGFHSPAEGVYHFDGNRDMDYLLSLCEEMRLLVLAAPGPYICSETQGGGHPTWLVAKKDIRIRHSASSFNKPFDVQYSHYCREWLHQILPIIAAHEITAIQSSSSKKRGCVIGVQIENENFENFKGIPVGCADDMRYLARVARECGITVPLFHNDGFEEGSWVSRDDNHREHGHSTFGLDWYAYDKYVVFCPTSTPQSLLVDPGPQGDLMVWEEWKPSCVEHCMDSMETKVRGFGGCAASAPMFIAELQGGWFNHYMLPCSYDDIYNYYGDDYTRLVLDSSLAQGVTMLNLYMAYGGTNWGTLGDPDVYTSYDYSACVREYGYLSGRGRKLRLGMAFARSFGAAVVARSERVAAKRVIEVVPRRMLNGQRRAGDGVVLSFWRNFSEKRTEVYTATVRGRPGVVLQGRLQYKRSFVGIGEYTSAGSGLRLLLATMPVHVRTHVKDSGSRAQRKLEVWVLQNDEFVGGELAFDGRVEVTRESRTLRPSVELVAGQTSIIRFGGDIGWCALRREGRVEDAGELLLLFLKEQDLMTLVPSFEENFWFDAEDKASAAVSTCDPLSLVWGAYGVQHDIKSGKLDIEWQCGQEFAYALFSASSVGFGVHGFGSLQDPSSPFLGFPGLRIRQRSASSTAALLLTRGPVDDGTPIPAKLGNWTTRDTQFEDLPWTELMLTGRDRSTPSLDSIDLGFTSGHVIYKLTINAKTFQPTLGVNLKLSINMRHRAVISLNGKHILGGHTTYAHRLMKAGSKQGPDPFKDTKDYILPFEQLYTDGQDNVVYVIVESFGLNRQAFILNDIRCRRGILNVGLVSVAGGGDFLGLFSRRIEFALHVTGVDIRTLNEPFNLCGFPDEHVKDGWMQASDCGAVAKEGAVSLFRLGADKLPRWFSGVMEVSPAITGRGLRVPLRFHVTGTATAHIWVDGVYLARYYGNGDCVQRDFYIPDTYAKGSRLVKVLVYDGRPGSDWIGIEVKGWEVAEGWSGNLMEGGEVFATCVEHWSKDCRFNEPFQTMGNAGSRPSTTASRGRSAPDASSSHLLEAVNKLIEIQNQAVALQKERLQVETSLLSQKISLQSQKLEMKRAAFEWRKQHGETSLAPGQVAFKSSERLAKPSGVSPMTSHPNLAVDDAQNKNAAKEVSQSKDLIVAPSRKVPLTGASFKAKKIFISYCWHNSRKQKEMDLLGKLCKPADIERAGIWDPRVSTYEIIKKLGFSPWLDVEQLEVGTKLEGSLADVLSDEVSLVIVHASDEYAASANCRKEFEFAMDLGLKIIPIIVGTPPIDPKKDPKGASVETNKKRKPWSKGWLGFSINHILYIDARNENALASSKKTVEETIAKEMLALFSIQAPQLSSSGQFSNIRDALLAGEETAVMSLIETTTEDLNMPCETGQTILELAVAKCSPETLEVLFKHGLRANLFNTAPLVIAVQRNARDLIELLIRYGADLNASNMMKATALHIAATVGTRELCELLLQNKANTEMYNSSGYTPFLAAVSAQKLENIVAFVENGSNIFALDQLDGNSSLHILCMNSQNAKTLEIFQILVQAGAQIEATNHDGFTPLAIAVSKGATQLVYEFMKDENADQIFRATVDGKSLLHLASQKGRMDLVKLFTSSKSPITYDLKAEDYNEMTPIGLAITNGWLDIVKYFVSLDTSLLTIKNDMHGSLQLIAAKNEQSDILRYLIVESGHSYDVKETDAETGMTSLIYKIKSGCHASIKILKTLEPGLLKMKSHDGTTTIAFAAGHGQLELLRQMLEDDEIRKNIKDIDSKGWTALTHAIENGSLEIVKVLCEADSSLLNKKDKKGRNMLSMAAMRNKFEIFDFILSHPDFEADLADVDSEGYSALHFAAQSGSLAIVEMLCDKYPTLMTLKTCHGANAVSLAAKYGCLDVLKVLVLNHQEIMFDLKVSDHTEGLTAFMNAVIHDHTSVLEFLAEIDHTLFDTCDRERRNPLFRAAWSASFHSLKYLLEQNYFKFDISSTDYHNNWNVMSYAVEGGSVDILHYLHKQNPSLINVKSVTLASLLHIATDTGDILYEEGNTKKANDTKLCECLKFLVPNGKFHLNEADAEGYSALARAIEGGLVKCSKYLLSLNPSQISFRMYDQQSLIHLAVGKGDNVDCLKFLLSDTYRSKFNLKATDRTGSAPLTLAVLKGNIKCVEYLLEVEPALISNRTEEGLSVLEIAAAAAQKRTFKFLFRYFEADLQSESFALSVLAFAAFGGHEGITKYARSKLDKIFVGMTHPATFDSITLSTLSCVTQYALTKSLGNVTKVLSMGFIIGSICNNHEVINTLVQLKIAYDPRLTFQKKTALYYAKTRKMVQRLLQLNSGYLLTVPSLNKSAFYTFAGESLCEPDHLTHILTTLVQLPGMDVNEGSSDAVIRPERPHFTPIHRACQSQRAHAIKVMLSLPHVDFTRQDADGCTPLHILAQHCVGLQMEDLDFIIRGMVQRGCDLAAVNEKGLTAAVIAEKRRTAYGGLTESSMEQVLNRYGAILGKGSFQQSLLSPTELADLPVSPALPQKVMSPLSPAYSDTATMRNIEAPCTDTTYLKCRPLHIETKKSFALTANVNTLTPASNSSYSPLSIQSSASTRSNWSPESAHSVADTIQSTQIPEPKGKPAEQKFLQDKTGPNPDVRFVGNMSTGKTGFFSAGNSGSKESVKKQSGSFVLQLDEQYRVDA